MPDRWSPVPLPPGRHRIMARATDGQGRTQPERAVWNAKGYGNNQMPAVEVQVGLLAGKGRPSR